MNVAIYRKHTDHKVITLVGVNRIVTSPYGDEYQIRCADGFTVSVRIDTYELRVVE